MMAKKTDTQNDEATSPLLASIDPRQAAAGGLTSTPDEGEDPRDQPGTDPKDNPAGPDDVSNVVDPSDPMTLTGEDAQPGDSGA